MAIIRRKNQMDFIIDSYENGALLNSEEVKKLDKEAEIREVDRQERILDLHRTLNSKVNSISDSESYPNTILSKFYADIPEELADQYYDKVIEEYFNKVSEDNYKKMEESKYTRKA